MAVICSLALSDLPKKLTVNIHLLTSFFSRANFHLHSIFFNARDSAANDQLHQYSGTFPINQKKKLYKFVTTQAHVIYGLPLQELQWDTF